MAKGEVVSTSGRPQQNGQKNTRVGHLRPKRPVAVLSEQKFRARFHIMDTILIQLTDGKERRGHIVKWVEKALFARLNKLFEIDAIEWAYKVLFLDKNMLALIGSPKSFIILVFPWLTPSSLVLGKHFMLKDLPFYEVARLADSEAR
uniref:Uncharacterized protein n=1 Tax=Vitis vinifera TaxID=29760 RepID=A5BLK9_VITVI|nr:hypothetical protein VITISV_040726 [Vitis vinifera]